MVLRGRSLEEIAWTPASRPRRGGLAAQGWVGADLIAVVLDFRDAACLELAAVLRREFSSFCRLVDFCDDAALAPLLEAHAAVPREELCRRGGATALLPEGTYLSHCETNAQMLLYELHYRSRCPPPAPAFVQRVEDELLTPLRRLRCSFVPCAQSPSHWWESEDALQLIARSLARNKFALVDNFLPDGVASSFSTSVRKLWTGGAMVRGSSLSGLATGDDSGDFQNKELMERKWTVRGDHAAHIAENSADVPEGFAFLRAADALIMALRSLPSRSEKSHLLCAETQVVAERLGGTDFREDLMTAIYPGATRSRYHPHIDNDRDFIHRSLTAILYLNPDWCREDGGELRLFNEASLPLPQPMDLGSKYDVVPEFNRLLVFWANEDCPHEVLTTFRDRFAATIFYVDGRRSASDSRAAARLALQLRPVMPLTHDEALERSAADAEQLIHFRAIHAAGATSADQARGEEHGGRCNTRDKPSGGADVREACLAQQEARSGQTCRNTTFVSPNAQPMSTFVEVS